MNTTKNLLVAAAVTGALVAYPLLSRADTSPANNKPTAEKLGCSGKNGCSAKDEGKDKKKKDKKKDKDSCSGKNGCEGK